MSKEIKTVAVIGAGYMGNQIAREAALHNYNVRIYDPGFPGYDRLVRSIARKAKRKNPSVEVIKCNSIKELVKNADLIVEAAPEQLDLKKEIFSEVHESAPPHAIIATNSSSIPTSKIEDAVKRKKQVLNIHFYNLTTIPMADLMRGTETSDEIFEKAREWVKSIEIEPLIVKKECFGFVFNRIWRAVKKDCLKIWAGGHADVEEVDKAWRTFTGMGLGPFQMMDVVGLDVVYDIEMSYYKQSGNPDDIPPDALKEKVEKGELGLKAQEGFYSY
ncbi:MAG: hypothetical protein GF383_05975 [Candidatus Lokiarchaeota archaeon]|nr:hypothetical protein [Candidatus Lokiarchaeota archaeon]MBD3339490.1 hypothetical protein [Candidatus Lokiarchaeota archaeon]